MSTNPRSTALFCEFVSDPTNDGTYILNLNAEETKFFFEKIHQIERDLIKANARIAEMAGGENLIMEVAHKVAGESKELVRMLEKDRARLDWLDAAPKAHGEYAMNEWYGSGIDYREAIDAAMRSNP